MAAATEPSIYTGTPGLVKNTTLLTHTAAKYVPKFREVVFSQYPFLKSLGLAAFGKKAMLGETSFGDVTKSSGKGITFNQGGYQFEFPIMTSAPSSYHVGYFDNINPQHNDPGNGGAYSWDRFVVPVMIPEEFMLDNVGSARLMNRFKTEMELAQRTAMRDLSYIILGHASAPTGAPEGLSQLVSVTQTAVATGSPGGLSPADYSWWNNQAVSCTSVGGGGEVDRPLQLIRSMEKLMLTCRNLSGASNDQTLVGTAGAWQYYGRARYADQTANGVPALRNSSYDAIDVDHLVFAGRPFIYDAAVTGPIGATASTESIYFLDYSEFGVNFKANEYFKVEGWEAPRAHDNQRFYQMNIWYRLVPYVTNRRIQGVLYSIPANSDAAATAATIPT